jgi:hypothetical protein
MKLTEPQLWWLRKAVAAGTEGAYAYGSSGTRVARTLAKYGLVNFDEEESIITPTELGHNVAEDGVFEV